MSYSIVTFGFGAYGSVNAIPMMGFFEAAAANVIKTLVSGVQGNVLANAAAGQVSDYDVTAAQGNYSMTIESELDNE